MKNRLSGLIGSLLILTIFLSCVSINGRTVSSNDIENFDLIGNVEITFTTYQFLHIITKKHKRNILLKAYSKLLTEAQFEYGLGVDVINIFIKGSSSAWNILLIPLNYAYGLAGNAQKITATGTVIASNYQVPLPITNRINTTETPMKDQDNSKKQSNQNNSQRQSRESTQSPKKDSVPKLSEPTLFQQGLNRLPAVPIVGKNLKFEFGGDIWIAKINGENFLAGDCIFEKNDNGYNITLKTTNVWSGAVDDVIDLFQKIGVPLGPATGPLRAAAKLAAKFAKWIPFNGSSIILEYNEDPPGSLRLDSHKK